MGMERRVITVILGLYQRYCGHWLKVEICNDEPRAAMAEKRRAGAGVAAVFLLFLFIVLLFCLHIFIPTIIIGATRYAGEQQYIYGQYERE